MNAWTNSARAELRRLLLWPVTWVLAGTWFALQILFSYVFPYIAYRSEDPDAFQGGPAQELLSEMMPSAMPEIMIAGTPMFGGAIVMIFAALSVGSAYGWGTWKSVLTQGPGRVAATGGMVAAIMACVVGLVVASAGMVAGLSASIAAIESQEIVWPAFGDMVSGMAGTGLVLGMWGAAGLFLGALTRGPALSVGLGLLWTLAVENLLRGVANLIDGLDAVTDVLPGSSAGSLAGAVGASSGGDTGTPGVLDALSGPTATGVVAAYLVVFVAITFFLIKRRDVV